MAWGENTPRLGRTEGDRDCAVKVYTVQMGRRGVTDSSLPPGTYLVLVWLSFTEGHKGAKQTNHRGSAGSIGTAQFSMPVITIGTPVSTIDQQGFFNMVWIDTEIVKLGVIQ